MALWRGGCGSLGRSVWLSEEVDASLRRWVALWGGGWQVGRSTGEHSWRGATHGGQVGLLACFQNVETCTDL